MSFVSPALVPELDVVDLETSRAFYIDVVGFTEVFSRPEETFLYLALGDAHLMLQEANGPGRRFRTAPLELPLGRGVNFQIAHPALDAALERLTAASATVVVPFEDKTYVADGLPVHVRQIVVSDPDGYLLRLQDTAK